MTTWQVIGPEGATWGLYNSVLPQTALDLCAREKQVFKDFADMAKYLHLQVDKMIDNKILLEKVSHGN